MASGDELNIYGQSLITNEVGSNNNINPPASSPSIESASSTTVQLNTTVTTCDALANTKLKDIEIRCLTLDNLRNKVKSAYLYNTKPCLARQERYRIHQELYHSGTVNTNVAKEECIMKHSCPDKNSQSPRLCSFGINTSPTRKDEFCLPINKYSEDRSTSITNTRERDGTDKSDGSPKQEVSQFSERPSNPTTATEDSEQSSRPVGCGSYLISSENSNSRDCNGHNTCEEIQNRQSSRPVACGSHLTSSANSNSHDCYGPNTCEEIKNRQSLRPVACGSHLISSANSNSHDCYGPNTCKDIQNTQSSRPVACESYLISSANSNSHDCDGPNTCEDIQNRQSLRLVACGSHLISSANSNSHDCYGPDTCEEIKNRQSSRPVACGSHLISSANSNSHDCYGPDTCEEIKNRQNLRLVGCGSHLISSANSNSHDCYGPNTCEHIQNTKSSRPVACESYLISSENSNSHDCDGPNTCEDIQNRQSSRPVACRSHLISSANSNSHDCDGPNTCEDIQNRQSSRPVACRSHLISSANSNSHDCNGPNTCEEIQTKESFEATPLNNQTHTVSSTPNFSKENLIKVVEEWSKDLPIYPTFSTAAQTFKGNVVTNLIEKIDALSTKVNSDNFVKSFEECVDKCINTLALWFPGSENEKKIIKKLQKEKIIDSIRCLNIKWRIKDNNNLVNNETNYQIQHCVRKDYFYLQSEIRSWFNKFGLSNRNTRKPNKENIDLFISNIISLVDEVSDSSDFKIRLKYVIFNLLNDSDVVNFNKNISYKKKIAEALSNKLIHIFQNEKFKVAEEVLAPIFNDNLKLSMNVLKNPSNTLINDILFKEIAECLSHNENHLNHKILKDEIDYMVTIHNGDFHDMKAEICTIIQKYSNLTQVQASNIVDFLIKNIESRITVSKINKEVTNIEMIPNLSHTLFVYGSRHCVAVNCMNTEKDYVEKLSMIIYDWMRAVPELNTLDKVLKDTIINDLIREITDQEKMLQVVPEIKENRDEMKLILILKWLHNINVFDDIHCLKLVSHDLVNHLKKVPAPNLITLNRNKNDRLSTINYPDKQRLTEVSDKTLLLQDEVSIWMDEQPTNIFADRDITYRIQMIEGLVRNIQEQIRCKKTDQAILNTIYQWLNTMLKSGSKVSDKKISQLKDRILKIQYDDIPLITQKLNEKEDKYFTLLDRSQSQNKIDCEIDVMVENNDTIKQFIDKYIVKVNEIDDLLVKDAFGYVLVTKLEKLSFNSINKSENRLSNSISHGGLSPESFKRKLLYVLDISDWLNSLPIESSLNIVGNKKRIVLVYNVAETICKIENEYSENPNNIDYKLYFLSSIMPLLESGIKLPEGYVNSEIFLFNMHQLFNKIEKRKFDRNYNNSTIKNEQIKNQDISNIIREFMYKYNEDIYKDDLNAETWYACLLSEIRKVFNELPNEYVMKASSHNEAQNLAHASINADHSVQIFDLELAYVREISEWLRNLPLKHLTNDLEYENLLKKIYNLSTKLRENIKNKEDENNILQEFIKDWILELPLTSSEKIVLPLVTSQLLNRIKKVNREISTNDNKFLLVLPEKVNISTNSKPINKNDNSSIDLVNVIETWVRNLPFHGLNDDNLKAITDNIIRVVCMKIMELNVDPTFDVDFLYSEILVDEIENHLNSISEYLSLTRSKKIELINKLLEDIKVSKKKMDISLEGNKYIYKLEKTIEANISNFVPDIGHHNFFQAYKNRLAVQFILDNFDHADDEVKLRYERKIKQEVDKYVNDFQKRNAIKLDLEKVNNQLYSILFTVPIPNQEAIADEVEKIKTRFEVDIWFKELPLRKASSLTEHLEWDEMLEALTKRVHEIEKTQPYSEANMSKEIEKWLIKFPLLPGQNININQFLHQLLQRLKSSKKERIYIPQNVNIKSSKVKDLPKINNKLGKSEVISLSASGRIRTNLPTDMDSKNFTVLPTSRKPSDLIAEVVEAWCNSLLLIATQVNNQVLKDKMATKIMLKISELNSDPFIFQNDFIYNNLLDGELDKILNTFAIPEGEGTTINRDFKKHQLIEAIKYIKPIIKSNEARHDYRQSLKHTAERVVNQSLNLTEVNELLFFNLIDDIIDNYVEFKFNGDNEEKIGYKIKIYDTVINFFDKIAKIDNKDPMIIRNQLICELDKIPIPENMVAEDEINEISVKNEISAFLYTIKNIEEEQKYQIRESLAKKLIDLERSHQTDEKIRNEIFRSLNKVGGNINADKVNAFLNKLQETKTMKSDVLNKGNKTVIGLPQRINQDKTVVNHKRYSLQNIPFIYPNKTNSNSKFYQQENTNLIPRQHFLAPSTANSGNYRSAYSGPSQGTTGIPGQGIPRAEAAIPETSRTERKRRRKELDSDSCKCFKKFKRRGQHYDMFSSNNFIPFCYDMPYNCDFFVKHH